MITYKVMKEIDVNNQRLSLVEVELITGFKWYQLITMNHLIIQLLEIQCIKMKE